MARALRSFAMPTLPAHGQESSTLIRELAPLNPASLAEAFESFTHAAGSLESSYTMLQGELARLRRELEIKNQDLARSVAENERMQAYLSGLLEDLPCGVLAVDASFRLRFANPHARTLLLSETNECTPATPIPSALRCILKEIAGEIAARERRWVFQTGEGPRSIAVTCALRPQRLDASGETVFILRDVSEQKRLEDEREQAHRMRALAEMTALLAHEIRNPLGSLELFAGLIREATKDHAEVSQWIVHIQAGLRALSATVSNVLHFHSLSPSHLKPLNAVELLANTVEFLQPLALQRGMGIEFSPNAKEILIPADAHRLQQVFFNLAINAFRAMPSGKCLRIGVTADQREGHCRARIDFADEGSGIAPEHIEKIFDAGFTTAKSSPGLGLAVCKRITAQHRGAIEVESELGRGTTFSIYLPVLGNPA